MKLKKYIALLLALAALLLTGCDELIDQFLENGFPNADIEENTTDDIQCEISDTNDPRSHASGILYSSQSDILVLFAEWHALEIEKDVVQVRISVGIHCYGISTAKHNLTVTVNGEKQTFQTPAIESKKNEEKTFRFTTFTFQTDLSKARQKILNVSAVWDFNGTYNGQTLDALSATAKISFPDGKILPEKLTTDTEDTSDTSKPIENPDAPMYRETGRISSTDSTMLVLFAKWTVVSKDGKTATVTVSPGIECYKFTTESHPLIIEVNGEKIEYTTPAITHGGSGKKTYDFTEKSFEIKLNGKPPHTLHISVTWKIKDDDGYNQGILEQLKAQTAVTFPGGTELSPRIDPQEVTPSASDGLN